MQSKEKLAVPEQRQTSTYLVFDNNQGPLTLMNQVVVPDFSQPDGSGTRLTRDKKLSLAVNRGVNTQYPNETYTVLTDTEGEFEEVEYVENPAFDAVWNPDE